MTDTSDVQNTQHSENPSSARIRRMTTTAVMVAVICILAPISLPIGPVPISLGTLAIYFTLYVLDWKQATIAVAVYILLGLVGLPVFSGYEGGPGKLFGPTGGYIIGYIPMCILIGMWLTHHYKKVVLSIIVMEAATWLLYMIGTAWLAVSIGKSFYDALALGVLPFIAGDLAKIIAAALVGPVLRDRLRRFTNVENC